MVERDLERAVVDLRPDVVDDLLAGADLDPLRLADVQPEVDGVAVVDARERGDVARLRGARAVVGEGAAGEREGRDGGGRGEEDEAARGHGSTLGAGGCRRGGDRT